MLVLIQGIPGGFVGSPDLFDQYPFLNRWWKVREMSARISRALEYGKRKVRHKTQPNHHSKTKAPKYARLPSF
eukprot:5569532-Amphidinium_carterae.1